MNAMYMKNSLFIARLGAFVLCCCQTWGQTVIPVVDGISTGVEVQCYSGGQVGSVFSDRDGFFWTINGLVYGLLQIPNEFVVCCDLKVLTIPVVLGAMNGSTFQCVSIDYNTNTVYWGRRTQLSLLPMGQYANVPLVNDTDANILELDYTHFSVGPVNTSIGWTYSNLTCEPAVFIIEGYDDRDAILADHPTTPELTLNSTSTLVLFPTSYITNSSLYLRLLAYDVSGTACAQDSTKIYYQLNDNVITPVHINNSSDGVTCIPIPVEVSSTRDYSSLEVLWPEKHNFTGKICYCPPFEGEYHLFSQCISTTSCDTDYSISVKNNSVCFAGESHELVNVPVYFTLLESCHHHRCIIRSVLAAFILSAPPLVICFTNTSVCFWSMVPVEYYLVNVTDASGNNTSLSGIYNTSQCLNITSDLFLWANDSTHIFLTVSVVAVSGDEIYPRTVNTSDIMMDDCLPRNDTAIKTDDTTTTTWTITPITNPSITKAKTRTTIIFIATLLGVFLIITLLLPALICLCHQRRKHKYNLNVHPSFGEADTVTSLRTTGIYEEITGESLHTTNVNETEGFYISIDNTPVTHPPRNDASTSAENVHRAYDVVTNENLPLPPDEPTYNTLQHSKYIRPNKTHLLQSDPIELEGAYDIVESKNPHVRAMDELEETTYYSTLGEANSHVIKVESPDSYKAECTDKPHEEAVYSIVDKTKKKSNYHMIKAESLSTDSTEVNGDEACKEAVYSTVDKTKRNKHYHMITAESLDADSVEINSDSTDETVHSTVGKDDHMITANSLTADSTEIATCTDEPNIEVTYSTVDKTKRNKNYFMITADNFDSYSHEADEVCDMIPEWDGGENKIAYQNATTITEDMKASHTLMERHN